MRVLITTFTYKPERNGVAECARIQAEGLARQGHSVTVATGRVPGRTANADPKGVEVIEFDVADAGNAGVHAGLDLDRYASYMRNADHDVILCHAWQCWSTDLAVKAFPDSRLGRKIMVSHGYSAHLWHRHARFPWGVGQWWRARTYVNALPQMLQAFDHVVFLSSQVDRNRFFDRWILERHGGPPASVIPNGTWPQQFDSANVDFCAEHGLGNRFVVLNVGAYTENKFQEASLRAFHRADIPDAALVFIGTKKSSYSRRLGELQQAWERSHPESRVLLLDALDAGAIHAAYRAADLFLCSSKSEVQPLVVLDAMGAGKPFISMNVGCVRELPGGVIARDESEMASLIRELNVDAKRREELGRAGRKAALNVYDWRLYQEAYGKLLETAPR